jgi:transposase
MKALVKVLLEQANQASKVQLQQAQQLHVNQLKIDALTHEIRLLRHYKFAAKSEGMEAVQAKLFEEAGNEDLAAAERQVNALLQVQAGAAAPKDKRHPVRLALPAHLPRQEVRIEPESTDCSCGQPMRRISEDVSERLDYVPGTFRVERQIRGVWSCQCCQRLVQQPSAAQVIESGIPTANLLAQVLISKYADHLPLYRQSQMYERQGVPLADATLGDWVGACGVALLPLVEALKVQLLQSNLLHADESPLKVLNQKGGKQNGYLWAYTNRQRPSSASDTQGGGNTPADRIVIYELHPSRGGEHVRAFLRHPLPPPRLHPPVSQEESALVFDPHWRGSLMVDDYAGYKALFGERDSASEPYITELGCWAHVRRKFHELHIANQSTLAAQALALIGQLYEVERRIVEQHLDGPQALRLRQRTSKPVTQTLHQWLLASLEQVSIGSATARALNYALRRWPALIRYLDDAGLPIDNNWAENQIRPCAIGRKNYLFAGSLRAGQRAAAIMTLIQTAKVNQIEPWQYLSDVLRRLPTHPNSQIGQLLPTRSGWSAHQASVNANQMGAATASTPSATRQIEPANPYLQLMR